MTYTTIGAFLLAAFFQLFLKNFLFSVVGAGRTIQVIEDFPYACRRIKHKDLEACEDMWLDEKGRRIYLACMGTAARMAWNPARDIYNLTGRRPGGAVISVLDIDEPGDDGLFGLTQLTKIGYEGAGGDGSLDTVGFDVEVKDNSTLWFYFVNMRPPVDQYHNIVDAASAGGVNATVELFELVRGSYQLKHIKTFSDAAIMTPNRVVAIGDGGFLFTNDHSLKEYSLWRELEMLTGGGNVGYCSAGGKCHIAAANGFNFPNGLTKGRDGLYYVPNTLGATINVMELQPDFMMKQIEVIHLGMASDNLAVDKQGDIYVAALPNALKFLASLSDPFNLSWPSTVLRIRKRISATGYEVEKIIEDRDARILSGASTARHDAKTGRLFMGTAFAPYIVVCDPT